MLLRPTSKSPTMTKPIPNICNLVNLFLNMKYDIIAVKITIKPLSI